MGVVPPGQPSLESIIDGEPTAPVKTKIVCTLGPKVRGSVCGGSWAAHFSLNALRLLLHTQSRTVPVLEELLRAGECPPGVLWRVSEAGHSLPNCFSWLE